MTNKTIDERFDELYIGSSRKRIKSFIHQALKEERENMAREIVEGVEKVSLIKGADDVLIVVDFEKYAHLQNQKMGIAVGYNHAVSDILSLIKKISQEDKKI